MTLTAQVLPN